MYMISSFAYWPQRSKIPLQAKRSVHYSGSRRQDLHYSLELKCKLIGKGQAEPAPHPPSSSAHWEEHLYRGRQGHGPLTAAPQPRSACLSGRPGTFLPRCLCICHVFLRKYLWWNFIPWHRWLALILLCLQSFLPQGSPFLSFLIYDLN